MEKMVFYTPKREVSGEIGLADTLILNIHPPDSERITICCLNCSGSVLVMVLELTDTLSCKGTYLSELCLLCEAKDLDFNTPDCTELPVTIHPACHR